MKRSFFCLIICVFSFLYSCTNSCKSVSNIPEKGDIVLILDSVPENCNYYRSEEAYSYIDGRYELRCNLNSMIYKDYNIDYFKNKDTIKIKDVDGVIEIKHKYKGLDILSFLAKPNDTLYFSYNGKMPVVRNSRKSKKYDYAYEQLIRKDVYDNDYSAYIKYSMNILNRNEMKLLTGSSRDIRIKQWKRLDSLHHAKYYSLVLAQYYKEEKILDSLILNDYISEDIAFFYKQRIKYNRFRFDKTKKDSLHFKDFKQNDDLLKYSFYKSSIYKLAANDIYSRVKYDQHSNGSDRNPIKIYKLIQENAFLSEATRKFLSYQCFKNIVEISSNKNINEYFKIFKSKYGKDTCLISHLVKEYQLGDEISNDLNLLTETGTKITFKELLEKNKGKLIYIDFWASWCAPCRRCMPASHKLREEFKGKDVVFVYLAFKDNLKSWKKAVEELDLKGYNDSYFIENSKSSKLIDDLKIGLIPRFLIYGKDGEILYKNAPRPSTKEIRDVFNELI